MMQGNVVSRWLKTTQAGYSSSKVARSVKAHTDTSMFHKQNIGNVYHMVFCSINHLYVALMSFNYNCAPIYTFMLPWQHHIRAGHLVLIVLIFDFNLSIIDEAVM